MEHVEAAGRPLILRPARESNEPAEGTMPSAWSPWSRLDKTSARRRIAIVSHIGLTGVM